MEAKIEEAVTVLTGRIKTDVNANDAMKYSQAVLNLTNALCAIKATKK